MTEHEYFGHLEMRICREFRGMRDPALRRYWCDGIIPEKFVITRSGSHMSGRVWIVGGNFEPCWNFVLLLGRATVPRDQIDWTQHLPPENVTGWMTLDFENQFMKMKPYTAVPDSSPPASNMGREDRPT